MIDLFLWPSLVVMAYGLTIWRMTRPPRTCGYSDIADSILAEAHTESPRQPAVLFAKDAGTSIPDILAYLATHHPNQDVAHACAQTRQHLLNQKARALCALSGARGRQP